MHDGVFEQDAHHLQVETAWCRHKIVFANLLTMKMQSFLFQYINDFNIQTSETRHPSGTGNVHAARERSCGYTRKFVFAISFPGDFLVVSVPISKEIGSEQIMEGSRGNVCTGTLILFQPP